MVRRNYILIILFLLTYALSAYAQPESYYYSSINGLKKEKLKLAIKSVISNHTKLSYSSSLPEAYRSVYTVDGKPGYVYDLFSYDSYMYTTTSKWNKEHVVPKSWWGGDSNNAYSDLFSVIPSDATANNRKGNLPVGEVAGSPNYTNGCIKVGSAVSGQGGTYSTVFEPADEFKGDFARIYFYVATCYSDINWGSSSNVKSEIKREDWPTLNPWLYNMLLKWHNQDPVSEKEKQINNAAEKIQHNRNPFIDYPVLADYIWGSCVDSVFSLNKAALYAHLGSNSGGNLGNPPTNPGDTIVTPPADTNTVVPDKYDYDWLLVKNETQLKAGDQLVLAYYPKNAVATDMGTSSYMGYQGAVFSEDFNYITKMPKEALILTLAGAPGEWKFLNGSGESLSASGSKTLKWSGGTDTWTIRITANGEAEITSSMSSCGTIQFNASAPRFLNYTSSQKLVQIYKKVIVAKLGDMNADGNVNVGDVTKLVGLIMSDYSENTDLLKVADITGDGLLNVGDLTKLVELVLKEE